MYIDKVAYIEFRTAEFELHKLCATDSPGERGRGERVRGYFQNRNLLS
jgi:hypothetical protein